MTDQEFGVSTHLFHNSQLTRDHLGHIARHGFRAVELFATRSHFDYRDSSAIARLAEWLRQANLTLHSVHAPIFEAFRGGQGIGSFSIAAGDDVLRRAAVGEIREAIRLADHVPYRFLVVHVGTSARDSKDLDNRRDAARRSVDDIAPLAAEAGIRIALEVIPNPLSSASMLVSFIEDDLDTPDVGICLDYGHAHLMGDLGEAIETISGHLSTTHVHDNGGRQDDHLVPFEGTIDWDAAMMETQKIGYDGVLMLEVADTGNPLEVLRQAAQARDRLEKTFVTF